MFDFIVVGFSVNYFGRRTREIWTVFGGFDVGFQEGVVEDWVDLHVHGEFQFTIGGGCPYDFKRSISLGC